MCVCVMFTDLICKSAHTTYMHCVADILIKVAFAFAAAAIATARATLFAVLSAALMRLIVLSDLLADEKRDKHCIKIDQ